MSESLFQPKEEGRSYGMSNYEGKCCEQAMFSDRVDMVKKAISQGFMTQETANLYGQSMVVVAQKYGMAKVEKYLRSLGWQ